jgi:hypothetical protein|tara:strand:- start:1650 stop:1901 length:252 start_codon:yes stop_codon:yes gene_type:complete
VWESQLTFICKELELKIRVTCMLMLVVLAFIVVRVLLLPSDLDGEMILEIPSWLRSKAFCFYSYVVLADTSKALVMKQNPVEE